MQFLAKEGISGCLSLNHTSPVQWIHIHFGQLADEIVPQDIWGILGIRYISGF